MRAKDAEQKKRLEANLQQAQAYYEELKNIKPPLPTRTLTKSVTLKEGGREIQILLLGRAHTEYRDRVGTNIEMVYKKVVQKI